jgi:putative CocE/NonD family hydrolase
VEVLRNCAISLEDGVELAADVYLPRTTGPVPALVTLIPYNKDGIAGVTAWPAHHHFARRGFACVVVDFRGTGSSGGTPRRPFDPEEGRDGAAAIAWAARQPWCDGQVGMWGVSYGAVMTLRTALLRPPALKAIVPVMGFLDPERDFVHPAGRRGCLASLGLWGLTTLAMHLTPPLLQDPDGRWRDRWHERLEHGEPYLCDLLEHGPGDAEWRRRAVDPSAIDIPTFCVSGWRDLSCDAMTRTYERVRGPRRLLVGPWMHTLPDDSPFEPVGFLDLAADWWDRWLRGVRDPDDEDDGVTVFVQGADAWRALRRWPAAGGELRFGAGGSGELTDGATKGLVERPIDPTVGVSAGLWAVSTRGFGLPRDQHDDDARSITFSSAPLPEALEVCGRAALRLTALLGPGPPRSVVVRLTHVGEDGRSVLITSGTGELPSVSEHELPAAGERAKRRCGVTLFPTAYAVPAGERLRLTVAGADFPRLWPEPRAGDLAVVCGAGGTELVVPLADAEAREIEMAPAAAPAAPSLVLRADPLYTVTRSPVTDEVTVTVGDHLLMKTPQEEHTLDTNGYMSATVSADRPDAAQLEGKAVTRVDSAHGEFVVRAQVQITGAATVMVGEVALGDEVVFSRRWTATAPE